ncbi:transposase [Burkholderia cepacia]|uniref:transposase n=1 Tax=Burkholderia cepacia TaxID=292 RepID=UPI0012D8E162
MDAPSDAKRRRTFSPAFKQQAACLVLNQGDSHMRASRSVGVGETVLRRCQLQMERQGVTPQGKAITPDRHAFRNARFGRYCVRGRRLPPLTHSPRRIKPDTRPLPPASGNAPASRTGSAPDGRRH